MKMNFTEKLLEASIIKKAELGFGLYYGETGKLLFYLLTKNDEQIERIVRKIEKLIVSKNTLPTNYAFGLSGVLTVLIDNDFISKSDVNGFIDNVKFKILNLDEYFLFDPFHGLLGYFQLLKSSNTLTNEILDFFIDKLNISLSTNSIGFYKDHHQNNPHYQSNNTKITRDVDVSYGMAHGNIAILYWLYEFEKQEYKKTDFKNKRKELERAFLNLLKTTPADELIPAAVTNDKTIVKASLGWCYSELPLINLMLSKGELNEEDQKIIINRLNNICSHFDKHLFQFSTDACLCHGISGVLYLFLKIRSNINLKSLDEPITLLKKLFEELINSSKLKNMSLLDGDIGSCLVLHSVQNKIYNNSWDRYLLID